MQKKEKNDRPRGLAFLSGGGKMSDLCFGANFLKRF
jgi:hypothetical protein